MIRIAVSVPPVFPPPVPTQGLRPVTPAQIRMFLRILHAQTAALYPHEPVVVHTDTQPGQWHNSRRLPALQIPYAWALATWQIGPRRRDLLPPPERALSPVAFAAYLGVPQARVERWLRQRLLVAYRDPAGQVVIDAAWPHPGAETYALHPHPLTAPIVVAGAPSLPPEVAS